MTTHDFNAFRLLVLCLLPCFIANGAAATLPTCTPSRDCALERAKWLAMQELTPDPVSGRIAPTPTSVQVLSHLILSQPQECRSGFTRTVLNRIIAAEPRAQLLKMLARNLIAQQQDAAALSVIIDIEDLAARDALYQEMAMRHVRAQQFELAYWVADRMRDGLNRDHLLLFIANRQVAAGQAVGASQTAAILSDRAPEMSRMREDGLAIQAQAAARLGDARGALELVERINQPDQFATTLRSIAEQQIKRNAFADALATVRFQRQQLQRRGATRPVVLEIGERLSQLGAAAEALDLVQGSSSERASMLAAIATGAARAGRFDAALATLDRIPVAERSALRSAAAYIAQLRAITGVDFRTAFDGAQAFSPLTTKERSRWVRDAATKLVRAQNLPRARDALGYEFENALEESECTASCRALPDLYNPAEPCDFGFRDEALCNVATLQAQLGFSDDAYRTALQIRPERVQISVQLAIAQAEITTGRTALVRETFAHALVLARSASNNGYLAGVIKAYADWVATAPLHYDALRDLYAATGELLSFDRNAACRPESAPLAVALAYASAGEFTTAFAMADGVLMCQQMNVYLSIFSGRATSQHL